MEKLNRSILNFFKSIKNFYTLTAKPFCDTIIIGISPGFLKELKGLRLKTEETVGISGYSETQNAKWNLIHCEDTKGMFE